MTTFKYNKGDRISFTREGEMTERIGEIQTVDLSDLSNPYYVSTPYGGYWIAEDEITALLNDSPLERLEAKLDAIIRHFNVPFER